LTEPHHRRGNDVALSNRSLQHHVVAVRAGVLDGLLDPTPRVEVGVERGRLIVRSEEGRVLWMKAAQIIADDFYAAAVRLDVELQ
jgi:hypothetical protein